MVGINVFLPIVLGSIVKNHLHSTGDSDINLREIAKLSKEVLKYKGLYQSVLVIPDF